MMVIILFTMDVMKINFNVNKNVKYVLMDFVFSVIKVRIIMENVYNLYLINIMWVFLNNTIKIINVHNFARFVLKDYVYYVIL
jgi:hypothetical protein